MAIGLIFAFGLYYLLWCALPNLCPPPDAGLLVANLEYVDPSFVGATWSLFVELGVAPAFVIVCLVAGAFGRRFIVISLLISILALFSTLRTPLAGPWTAYPLNKFFFFFLIGASLTYGPSRLARIPERYRGTAMLLSWLMLGFARGLFGAASHWSLLAEGLSSAVLVAIAAYSAEGPSVRWLDHTLIRSLGRVSYSFYLYHAILYIGLIPFFLAAGFQNIPLAPVFSGLIVAVVTVPLSLIAARLSYEFIEVPTIALCKALDRCFDKVEIEPSNAPLGGRTGGKLEEASGATLDR
jgi:peptidoglycan/LPS O-acetylase OafA/YrhL